MPTGSAEFLTTGPPCEIALTVPRPIITIMFLWSPGAVLARKACNLRPKSPSAPDPATPAPIFTPMSTTPTLRAGMVGLGMIFDETYRPFFERAKREGLFSRETGLVEVDLAAVASRTGARAERYRAPLPGFTSFTGEHSAVDLANSDLDIVCVATPDDRHFAPAAAALKAGKHVLIEKPSVLSLQELDELQKLADDAG